MCLADMLSVSLPTCTSHMKRLRSIPQSLDHPKGYRQRSSFLMEVKLQTCLSSQLCEEMFLHRSSSQAGLGVCTTLRVSGTHGHHVQVPKNWKWSVPGLCR